MVLLEIKPGVCFPPAEKFIGVEVFNIQTEEGIPLSNNEEYNHKLLKAISVDTGLSIDYLDQIFGDGHTVVYSVVADTYTTYIPDPMVKITLTFEDIFKANHTSSVEKKGFKSIW